MKNKLVTFIIFASGLGLLNSCGSEPTDAPATSDKHDLPTTDSSTEKEPAPVIESKQCDIDTAQAYCRENQFIFCDNGTWSTFNCPDGFACAHDGLQALCLAKCDHEGDEATICSSSIQLNTVCAKLDGGLFQIPDYDSSVFCQQGCADLKTCKPE